MAKRMMNYKVLAFTLLAIMLFSLMTQPAVSKYVLTQSGRAASSLISANVFTDAFVVGNDTFIVGGTEVDSVTSKNLFGIGVNNGTISEYNSDYALDSVNNQIFVVQNNSDYDLVACFDVLVCLGDVTTGYLNPTLTLTITEQTSGTSLTVSAKKGGSISNGQAPLIAHAENQSEIDSGDYQGPIINCAYNGILGRLTPYRAYSTTINPSNYKGTSVLSEDDFRDFILVPSGQTRTFVLSVSASGTNIGSLDRNAYASMTMTCVKHQGSTT